VTVSPPLNKEFANVPGRTNEFQQLVGLIEKSLAPKAAKVTESAMLPIAGMSGPGERHAGVGRGPQ
jgi:hypothetical protein